MRSLGFPLLVLSLSLGLSRAVDVEERRATGSLPAHVAATFDEMAACHLSPNGEYLIFDRRAHAVYTFARGAEGPKRIVQIGSETGRIIRPTAFDSAADGSFVVADAPEDRQRVQFFSATGSSLGGFTMPGRGVPQITLGDLVLSGLGTLEYTGQTVLISQPELGSLIVEYLPTGTPLRTFGELRATGQENDPQVHAALNVGISLLNPKGGYYFVFLSGVPMFRKYDPAGKLVFERHIEGVELDPYIARVPTTWPRKRGEIPLDPRRSGPLRSTRRGTCGSRWPRRTPMSTTRLGRSGTRCNFAAPASSLRRVCSSRGIATCWRRRGATPSTRAIDDRGRLSHQLSDRSEVEVQILRAQAELLGQIANRLFEFHQRQPDRFRFLRRQRIRVHAADCLALEDLADELDECQHELQDRFPHVIGIGIPPCRRGLGKAIQLCAQRFDFVNGNRSVSRSTTRLSGTPGAGRTGSSTSRSSRSFHGHGSGANAKGGQGPLTLTSDD